MFLGLGLVLPSDGGGCEELIGQDGSQWVRPAAVDSSSLTPRPTRPGRFNAGIPRGFWPPYAHALARSALRVSAPPRTFSEIEGEALERRVNRPHEAGVSLQSPSEARAIGLFSAMGAHSICGRASGVDDLWDSGPTHDCRGPGYR